MLIAKDDSQSWDNTAAKAAVAEMAVIVHGLVLSSNMDICVDASTHDLILAQQREFSYILCSPT